MFIFYVFLQLFFFNIFFYAESYAASTSQISSTPAPLIILNKYEKIEFWEMINGRNSDQFIPLARLKLSRYKFNRKDFDECPDIAFTKTGNGGTCMHSIIYNVDKTKESACIYCRNFIINGGDINGLDDSGRTPLELLVLLYGPNPNQWVLYLATFMIMCGGYASCLELVNELNPLYLVINKYNNPRRSKRPKSEYDLKNGECRNLIKDLNFHNSLHWILARYTGLWRRHLGCQTWLHWYLKWIRSDFTAQKLTLWSAYSIINEIKQVFSLVCDNLKLPLATDFLLLVYLSIQDFNGRTSLHYAAIWDAIVYRKFDGGLCDLLCTCLLQDDFLQTDCDGRTPRQLFNYITPSFSDRFSKESLPCFL